MPYSPVRNLSICVSVLLACAAGLAVATAREGQPEPKTPNTSQPSGEQSEAELFMLDGRRINGTLVAQDDRTITLRIAGIETPFPRSMVDRLRIIASVDDQYRQLKDSIDPRNIEDRMRLAEWLRSKDRHDSALSEIDAILIDDPTNHDARELRLLIQQQKSLKEKARPSPARPKSEKPREAKARPQRIDFPVLTPDEINLIKVFELNLDDPPRMSISREAIDRFLRAYAGRDGIPTNREGRDAFYRKRPEEIVSIMFRLRAREFYGEVKVLEHPRAARQFRDNVHRTWLLNSCATNACHGGEQAGRLWLKRDNPTTEATIYTNLLILDRFRLANGLPLIDYTEPHRSPLLHLGLPKEDSLFHHPDVVRGPGHERWRPVFRDRDEERFRAAVEWISSMYRPRPDYPIVYNPPTPPKPPAQQAAPETRDTPDQTQPGTGDEPPPSDPPPPR